MNLGFLPCGFSSLRDDSRPSPSGNDLARVLRWGPGYTGGEDPLNLLRDVIEAEEIRLDRWTVVFHPEDKQEDVAQKAPSTSTGKKKKVHSAQTTSQQQQNQQQHHHAAITTTQTQGHLVSINPEPIHSIRIRILSLPPLLSCTEYLCLLAIDRPFVQRHVLRWKGRMWRSSGPIVRVRGTETQTTSNLSATTIRLLSGRWPPQFAELWSSFPIKY